MDNHARREEAKRKQAEGLTRTRTPEEELRRSTGLKKAWAEGKFNRERSPEEKLKRSAGMKQAWAKGKFEGSHVHCRVPKNIPAASEARRRQKISASLVQQYASGKKIVPAKFRHHGCLHTGETRGKISAKVRQAFAEGRLTPLKHDPTRQQALTAAVKLRCTGAHGFGRAQRDRPDHAAAKLWVVESPNGVRYTFPNLRSWCRANEALFTPTYPPGKLPLWLNASTAITNLGNRDNCSQWKGWRLIHKGGLQEPVPSISADPRAGAREPVTQKCVTR